MNYVYYDNSPKTVTASISLESLGFLTWLVFLILKVTNVFPESFTWFWVWFPLWFPIALAFGIFLIGLIIFGVILLFNRS